MFRQYFYPVRSGAPRRGTSNGVYLKNKQASILIICLWTIMILSMLGMGIAGLVFQEIKFVKAYQRLSFSLPIAKAALRAVFYMRKEDSTSSFDTFEELARENSQSLCGNNAYKYYLADKRGSLDKVELIDEGALINLNSVSVDTLKRLPGIDEEIADKIANYAMRPFKAINEVLLIEGMTKEKFLLFKDLVTVYGSGKININTASSGVLLALGLDADTVEVIFRCRQKHKIDNPNPESSEDFGYGFSSVDKILDDLRTLSALSTTQEQNILALLPVLDVRSEYLRLNIIPSFSGGREGLHYSIVIKPITKEVLSWNEY